MIFIAEVAELVDALASGASGGNPVEVQVLSSAPKKETIGIFIYEKPCKSIY